MGRLQISPPTARPRYLALRHVPADVPLRDHLEPAARRASSGSATTVAIRPPGLFALYVAGYSAFRIFEESLRVDPAHHIFGLRLNLYVAAILTVVGVVWFVRTQRGGTDGDERATAAAEPVSAQTG